MKTVVVGSNNPVKLAAAQQAFGEMFPEEVFSFVAHTVGSGVSDQPVGIEETKQGATNRALACREMYPEADYWLGLEGGIEIIETKYYVSAWMCVTGKNGQVGYGRTGAFMVPLLITERIKQGEELGTACDNVFSQINSGYKGGAVSILTDGKITRADFYVPAIMFALISFSKTELFE